MTKPIQRFIVRLALAGRFGNTARQYAQRREFRRALLACGVTATGLCRLQGPQAVRRTWGDV
ncbi:hypothetical protein [Lysobacter sp. CA199]|uniref:hypothetical protein n=1 Tax=Lysobacter sp. CA199 TaxID=3455608 RepID=UPI003F8D824C